MHPRSQAQLLWMGSEFDAVTEHVPDRYRHLRLARLWRRGAALPGVQNGAGGASLRHCGAARVAMRKRGAKHRAVRQHGGCA